MEGNHHLAALFVHIREPRRLNRGYQRTPYDPLVQRCAAVTKHYFVVLSPLPRIPEQRVEKVSEGQYMVNSDTDLLVLSFNSVIALIRCGRKIR